MKQSHQYDPLVSIIIPTFNRVAFIGKTIESILAQTYTNWECIVVDDGSTDNTSLLLSEYCSEDARIRYDKRPESYPKGSNGSRNYGISLSQGSLIAFCDDDDFWLVDKLAKQIPIFEAHPEIGLVTGNIEFVNIDGIRRGRIINQTGNHGYVFEQLLFKNRLSMITPILRREVFSKVGLFNTDFEISEDWEYWRRVAYCYPFYALPDVLACVRKHDSNTSLIVTDDPFEQYVRYRNLTKALLKWGEQRFSKTDKKLIAKVEVKRYKQLLRNHCPGIKNKLKIYFKVLDYDYKGSYALIKAILSYN